jgi:hypothetical protein
VPRHNAGEAGERVAVLTGSDDTTAMEREIARHSTCMRELVDLGSSPPKRLHSTYVRGRQHVVFARIRVRAIARCVIVQFAKIKVYNFHDQMYAVFRDRASSVSFAPMRAGSSVSSRSELTCTQMLDLSLHLTHRAMDHGNRFDHGSCGCLSARESMSYIFLS